MAYLLSPWKDWCMNLVNTYTNSTSNAWKQVGDHELFQRIEFAMAVHKNRYIIIAGGNRGDGVGIKSAGIYDIKSDRHTELPDLPEDFQSSYCGGVVLNNYFYVYSLFFKEAMYRINLSRRQKWENMTSHTNEDIRVIASERNLYALSGYQNTIYDPISNEWGALPPMNTPRQHFAHAMVDNKIYTIGGYSMNQKEQLSSVEVFDTATHTWSTTAPLPNPLAHAAASVVGKWIVVTGGRDENDNMPSHSFIFDTQRQQWIKNDMGLSSPRQYHGCVTIGEEIICVGGCSEQDRNTIFSMESINKRHLIPNLAIVEQLVQLRKLVEDDRAVINTRKITDEDKAVQEIVTSLPDDLFRQVASFAI